MTMPNQQQQRPLIDQRASRPAHLGETVGRAAVEDDKVRVGQHLHAGAAKINAADAVARGAQREDTNAAEREKRPSPAAVENNALAALAWGAALVFARARRRGRAIYRDARAPGARLRVVDVVEHTVEVVALAHRAGRRVVQLAAAVGRPPDAGDVAELGVGRLPLDIV